MIGKKGRGKSKNGFNNNPVGTHDIARLLPVNRWFSREVFEFCTKVNPSSSRQRLETFVKDGHFRSRNISGFKEFLMTFDAKESMTYGADVYPLSAVTRTVGSFKWLMMAMAGVAKECETEAPTASEIIPSCISCGSVLTSHNLPIVNARNNLNECHTCFIRRCTEHKVKQVPKAKKKKVASTDTERFLFDYRSTYYEDIKLPGIPHNSSVGTRRNKILYERDMRQIEREFEL